MQSRAESTEEASTPSPVYGSFFWWQFSCPKEYSTSVCYLLQGKAAPHGKLGCAPSWFTIERTPCPDPSGWLWPTGAVMVGCSGATLLVRSLPPLCTSCLTSSEWVVGLSVPQQCPLWNGHNGTFLLRLEQGLNAWNDARHVVSIQRLIESVLRICGFHISGFNQPLIENIQINVTSLMTCIMWLDVWWLRLYCTCTDFLCVCVLIPSTMQYNNYSDSIYIVLNIISHLEVI